MPLPRLYLAGPITFVGPPTWNRPAFEAAAEKLRALGYEVVNPVDLDPPDHEPGSWTWEAYMRRDLKALLDCEAVALLPDWEQSPGALLERHVARELGMTVLPVESWLAPYVEERP